MTLDIPVRLPKWIGCEYFIIRTHINRKANNKCDIFQHSVAAANVNTKKKIKTNPYFHLPVAELMEKNPSGFPEIIL